MPHIFGVRELTQAIKEVLEGSFPFVWVRGQVSNVSRPVSGHVYFTLRDADASLGVVWFKGNQWIGSKSGGEINPETGEYIEDAGGKSLAGRLVDGMDVTCAGRLNVYPPRGTYQLVAEYVQEAGLGELFLAFEELKKNLAAKGYFDSERKRPIPYSPAKAGVITAPGKAAIRDFLRIASDRGLGARIRIYPSLMQGEKAYARIPEAIRLANDQDWADVLVIIRGGGSIEDLWAFNTEEVARAVFESRIPVVTGIGHEIDTTIADLTADIRAATPSHAAQLLWPERREFVQFLDTLEISLNRGMEKLVSETSAELRTLERLLRGLSPLAGIERAMERFEVLGSSLNVSWKGLLSHAQTRLSDLENAMHVSYRPSLTRAENDLERFSTILGYAMQKRLALDDGFLRDSLNGLRKSYPPYIARAEKELDLLNLGLEHAMERRLSADEALLALLHASLEALNPENPLKRGYAMVRCKKTGALLNSPAQVASGDDLDILVRDGHVDARVL